MIQRINYLSRKQRSEGLTPGEKNEQDKLRQDYLKCIRKQITDTLDDSGFSQKN
ncbi:MAG: DUF896 domain-containing protein [Clostridiales bacterium]|nr:DUF896 domain-containing protein [Clostridiales bacterium]MCF8021107.1 DUF896 domain-containing protein [Clostridiales bacterium]